MARGGITIGVVAPAVRTEPTIAEAVTDLAAKLYPEHQIGRASCGETV